MNKESVGYAYRNKYINWNGDGLYILLPQMNGVMSFYDGVWEKANDYATIEKYVKRWGGVMGTAIRYIMQDMLEVLE